MIDERPAPAGNPIARGSLVALLAAVLFGLTTPLVKHFGAGVGAFETAALLYGGAMLAAGPPRARAAEAPVRLAHAPRLAVVALFGAALAPACLAWGLQRADATAGSLMLNLEAVFTVVLARALYQEPIGRRVVVAASLILAGGAVLVMRANAGASGSFAGLAAITLATAAWAIDSALTRPLADLDPRAVVFWKATIGVALSVALAVAFGDSWPSPGPTLALIACGAAGYGLSLRAYLLAQRVLGAGRTASLFAVAPFIGAVAALGIGLDERHGLVSVAVAAVLFSAAAALHASERHAHAHRHAALAHEHAHRHDDAHHDHAHEPPVLGAHSHWHDHATDEHEHPHGPDLHHRHGHERNEK